MLLHVVSCLATAVLTFAAVSLAAQTEDVERLLKAKPSPGTEALLLAHASDGRVGRRWIGLLTHADTQIRLSAARALGVTNVRAAAADLLQALAREQEAAVVAELVQAVAVVAPDDDVLQVYAHLDRLDEPRAVAIVEGLAAARPSLVARHLQSAAPLRFNPAYVAAAFGRLAVTSPAAAAEVEASLATEPDPTMVEGLIAGATTARHALPHALVAAGLRQAPAGRLATVAYLAASYGSPADVPADLRSGDAAAPGGDVPEERWVQELVRRWQGQPTSTDLALLATSLPPSGWLRATPPAALAVLTADERVAFAARLALSRSATEALMLATPGPPPPPVPVPVVGVLTDVPAAMLAEVVRLTGCRPQSADERFASIRYHPDRRPRAIGPSPEPWSPGCQRAARAAVAMSYGVPPRSDEERALALVRLDADFASCLANRQRTAGDAVRPGQAGDAGAAEGVPPRKLHHVPPAYPDVAIRSRLQGIVTVDARIERDGCVSEARVIQSVHAFLDTSALQAVSRWRYTPTTLNGAPVPVLMTVEVNFSLQ